jgi:hypothetical protein
MPLSPQGLDIDMVDVTMRQILNWNFQIIVREAYSQVPLLGSSLLAFSQVPIRHMPCAACAQVFYDIRQGKCDIAVTVSLACTPSTMACSMHSAVLHVLLQSVFISSARDVCTASCVFPTAAQLATFTQDGDYEVGLACMLGTAADGTAPAPAWPQPYVCCLDFSYTFADGGFAIMGVASSL